MNIEDILNSADHISRAEASESLFEGAYERAMIERKIRSLVPPRRIWMAAACLALLAGINWFSFSRLSGQEHTGQDTAQSFQQEYFPMNTLSF